MMSKSSKIKQIIRRMPVLGPLAVRAYTKASTKRFPGSQQYWQRRYVKGGGSGEGSYGRLAWFKAKVVNDFVKAHQTQSVIEYGCGDGNQLRLAEYHNYLGFDVSPAAVAMCRESFRADDSKRFELMSEYDGERAELTLSLDVIYHLVEDTVFEAYMRRLFDSSDRFVIIYSSDTREQVEDQPPHIKHRKFTEWVGQNMPEWELVERIPNRYPYGEDGSRGSCADLYVYGKA